MRSCLLHFCQVSFDVQNCPMDHSAKNSWLSTATPNIWCNKGGPGYKPLALYIQRKSAMSHQVAPSPLENRSQCLGIDDFLRVHTNVHRSSLIPQGSLEAPSTKQNAINMPMKLHMYTSVLLHAYTYICVCACANQYKLIQIEDNF